MAIGDNLTKREQTSLAIALLAVTAAGSFWNFVYRPRDVDLAANEIRIETLERHNQQARADLNSGTTEDLIEEARMYEASLSLIRRLVPTSNEVPALLEGVSNAARRVGLDLASVEPVAVIYGDQFDTYRYKIAVLGGYHEVARFLSNIGSMDRIVAPVGLELTLNTPHSEQVINSSKTSSLIARFQIQTYVAHTGMRDSQIETR